MTSPSTMASAATSVVATLTSSGSLPEWSMTATLRMPDPISRPTEVFLPPNNPNKRSEEHTSELQSRLHLVCRLLLEKKKNSPRGGPLHAPTGTRKTILTMAGASKTYDNCQAISRREILATISGQSQQNRQCICKSSG